MTEWMKATLQPTVRSAVSMLFDLDLGRFYERGVSVSVSVSVCAGVGGSDSVKCTQPIPSAPSDPESTNARRLKAVP